MIRECEREEGSLIFSNPTLRIFQLRNLLAQFYIVLKASHNEGIEPTHTLLNYANGSGGQMLR